MNVSRNMIEAGTGTSPSNPRQPINSQTGWLDASVVYGASAARAALLRTFVAGLMHEDADAGLPVNNIYPNQPCVEMQHHHRGPLCGMRMAGDVRANLQPGLLALQGLFVKEHNWWARKLKTDNPTWNDETLFQEARKRVAAEMQAITYNEYLPELTSGPMPAYTGYAPSTDPRVDVSFAIAAYRYGHSGINNAYLCILPDGAMCSVGLLNLRDVYFSPQKYLPFMNIGDILRGQVLKMESKIDTAMVDDVRNFLEGKRADLAAMDIGRGRDMGLPTYTQARAEYAALGYNLPPITRWADVTSDSSVQDVLASLYGSPSRCDLWVCGLAESGTSGFMVGPTFSAIIRDQFIRLRNGDRFYFENTNIPGNIINGRNVSYFTDEERMGIMRTRLSDVIKRNTDFTNAPMAAFQYYPSIAEAAAAASSTGGAAPSPAPVTGTGTGPRTVAINNLISMTWTPPTAAESTITLTFRYQGTGWLGVGLGSSMLNADVWLMTYANGQGSVSDQRAGSSYVVPATDASQDVTMVSATQANGITTYTIRRALATGDGQDRDIVRGQSTPFIFAWDLNSNAYLYHGTNKLSPGSIDLFSAPSAAANATGFTGGADDAARRAALASAYGFHGMAMFACWGVLAPSSSIALHFFKHKSAVYAFHKWAGLVVTSLTLPAAGTAIVASAGGISSLVHANLGMCLAVVLLAQVIMGATVRNWLRGDASPPAHWYYIRHGHRYIGYAMLISGFANCILGMDMLFGETAKWAVLAYFLTLICACALYSAYDEVVSQKDAQPRIIKLDQDQARRFSMSTSAQSLTITEVRENCRAGCRWVILGGYVYDVGPFLKSHPGGAYLLERCIGSDISQFFYGREAFDSSVPKQRHSQRAWALLRNMCVAALKQPLLVKSWADAPAMPEEDCTETWQLVNRTVLPGERRRPVVKLEFTHPAAQATDPSQWKPTSFGRYMVVKVPTFELEKMLEEQDGHTAALNAEKREQRRGSTGMSMFSLDAILRPLGLQKRKPVHRDFEDEYQRRLPRGRSGRGEDMGYGHGGYGGSMDGFDPHPEDQRQGRSRSERPQAYGRSNRIAPLGAMSRDEYAGFSPSQRSLAAGGMGPMGATRRMSQGRYGGSMEEEPYAPQARNSRGRDSRSAGPSSGDPSRHVAAGSVTGSIPALVKQATMTPYARARMTAWATEEKERERALGVGMSRRVSSQPPPSAPGGRSAYGCGGSQEYAHGPSFGPALTSSDSDERGSRGRGYEGRDRGRDSRPGPGRSGFARRAQSAGGGYGPSQREREPEEDEDAPPRRRGGHDADRPWGQPAFGFGADGFGKKGDGKEKEDSCVERPYSIVRPGDKPGLVLYVRRYPRGLLSRYLYGLRAGDNVTMVGPKGLGLHLDEQQSGVIVCVYQGTGVVTAFDLMQHIYACFVAKRKQQGKAEGAQVPTWSREQFEQALKDGRVRHSEAPPMHAQKDDGIDDSTHSSAAAHPVPGVRSGISPAVVQALRHIPSQPEDMPDADGLPDPLLRTYGYQPGLDAGVQPVRVVMGSPAPALPPRPSVVSPHRDGSTPSSASDELSARDMPHDARRTPGGVPPSLAIPLQSVRVDGGGQGVEEETGRTSVHVKRDPLASPAGVNGAETDFMMSGAETDGLIKSRVSGKKAKKARFKLVLLACFEHEDAIIEPEWMSWLDEMCADFELHINLSRPRDRHAVAERGLPRVTTGRLTASRLEKVLPPANLLMVSLCGTPDFVKSVRETYRALGLPKSLLTTVG